MENTVSLIVSFFILMLCPIALAAVVPTAAYVVRKMNEFLQDK